MSKVNSNKFLIKLLVILIIFQILESKGLLVNANKQVTNSVKVKSKPWRFKNDKIQKHNQKNQPGNLFSDTYSMWLRYGKRYL